MYRSAWKGKLIYSYYKSTVRYMDSKNVQIGFWDKPIVRFVEDDTSLNSKFKKGYSHEVFLETSEHYILLEDGVFYGTYKSTCELI